ncbi:DUF2911 domain-containing protein [Algoriphagus hitonicola]|uniref:DUF2911 domain-containing protein n=1 Tax=Algoriphagus hitonicola TaxID=435880 RepID=A0A1I2XBA5_9BACT|nr:DUF2911 domain-containing protein [Algoriphagus hitonicola]SFH10317.1 Protein of unknown function [Algoriphagus hitonicola]
MKKTFSMLAVALFLIGTAAYSQQLQMPQASPSAKISQKVGLTDVTVDYSRPSTKGRKIFGELVPYGQVWRTGANAATILDFSTDVEISGNPIPAGKYAMYSIPDKDKWTIVFSKNTELWGAIGYNTDEDVLRFEVEPKKLSRKYETFEISFNNMTDDGADLSLKWENTRIDFRISTEVEPIVMAQIQELVIDTKTENPSLLYAAANYYFTNQKDMNQAYTWISKSVESDPKYWTMHLKAKIEAALGKNEDAIASAKKSMEMAEIAKNPDYIALNERLIKSLK